MARMFGLAVALIGLLFVAVAVLLLLTAYSRTYTAPATPACWFVDNGSGGYSQYCPRGTP